MRGIRFRKTGCLWLLECVACGPELPHSEGVEATLPPWSRADGTLQSFEISAIRSTGSSRGTFTDDALDGRPEGADLNAYPNARGGAQET